MTSRVPRTDTAPQTAGLAPDVQSRGEDVYSSRDLFRDKTEIHIEHQGALYRLRITRSGGLLLNK